PPATELIGPPGAGPQPPPLTSARNVPGRPRRYRDAARLLPGPARHRRGARPGAARPRREHPRVRPAHGPRGAPLLPAHPLRLRGAPPRPPDARAGDRRGRRAPRDDLAPRLVGSQEAHGDLRLAHEPLPLRPAAAPPGWGAPLRDPPDREQPPRLRAGRPAVRDP